MSAEYVRRTYGVPAKRGWPRGLSTDEMGPSFRDMPAVLARARGKNQPPQEGN